MLEPISDVLKKQISDHEVDFAVYDPHLVNDWAQIQWLQSSGISLFDNLENQLTELMEVRNPSEKGQKEILQNRLKEHLTGQDLDRYGRYVFYPWRAALVHILPEDEFVEVRTNRNRDKVTKEQIASFRKKKIGIVGLSVGQMIAVTLAMESLAGELRLADFDDLELSNMNRIHASLLDQGLPKVEIARRTILEMDPYIKVRIFGDGLTQENMQSFLTEEGKLDVLIDECDSIEMKIRLREQARELAMPVFMETSDRGLIDIERFDLSPHSHILDNLTVTADDIQSDPNNKQIAISQIIDFNELSEGMKASMPQIGVNLLSWPQLASDVTLGGASMATCCRLLFTNANLPTRRIYLDVSKRINQPSSSDQGL